MAVILVLGLLLVAGAVWMARSRATGADKKGPGAGRMELPPVPVVAGIVAGAASAAAGWTFAWLSYQRR